MKLCKSLFVGVVLIASLLFSAAAQDTLPNFSVQDIGKGKLLISWTNPFDNCVQIAVQRSFDSTKFFTTIYSPQSPNLPQNGVTEEKMPQGIKAFYRIFYVLDGGAYFFSKSKSVASNVVPATIAKGSQKPVVKPVTTISLPQNTYPPEAKTTINIYKNTKDSLLFKLEYEAYRKFKDSIINKTKDTLYTLGANDIIIKPFAPKFAWKPSQYIFTNHKGFVTMSFPLIKQHKYHVVFFEENGAEIFQIKQIKESELVLDNGNFLHSGWFYFELFEDEKLKEKNKFYLQSPF